eukprot:m.222363 g.222363  ORF g.222363 m.222363 type:complete len:245 (+) comp15932_c0_seq2:152-886(+)
MMREIITTCVFVFALWASVAHGQILKCGTPDTKNARCECQGVVYDFSEVVPTYGNKFFNSPGYDNQCMYYFQMVEGGLPDGKDNMSYCDVYFPGYVAAEGQMRGSAHCDRLGRVDQQNWSIDERKNPQEITIHFTGGDKGRSVYTTFQCDPNDGDPTFSFSGDDEKVYYMNITTIKACPPPATYRCIDNACVPSKTGGVNATECNRMCDNTMYRCEENKCVVASSGGVPLEECKAACGVVRVDE